MNVTVSTISSRWRHGIFLVPLLAAVFAQGASAQTEHAGFGALDVISGAHGSSFGALDCIAGSAGKGATPQEAAGVGAVSLEDVLSVVTTAGDSGSDKAGGDVGGILAAVASGKGGEYRPGALSFISRYHQQGNYYSTGAWDLTSGRDASAGSLGTMWTGQMLQAPQWGKITSGFGYRPRFGRMHKGIDIAMTVGDTVCVPLPGVVDRISYEARGYGHYVVIKHADGLETRYAHLSATLVTPGDMVAANQPIALSGNTGNSTGPHLHFETRLAGTAIDPQSVFDFNGTFLTPRMMSVDGAGRSFASASGGAYGAMSVAKAGASKSLGGKRTYVVRAGDTLEKIAARAGVSVFQLCRLNFISENQPLTPGTMLKIRR